MEYGPIFVSFWQALQCSLAVQEGLADQLLSCSHWDGRCQPDLVQAVRSLHSNSESVRRASPDIEVRAVSVGIGRQESGCMSSGLQMIVGFSALE